MPQLQVVNLTRDKPEPTGIQEFFSKLGKDYKDKQDKVEVGKLLDEYKQNRNDANAWEDLQLGLEKSNISPTKRLEVQNSLNNTRKMIIEKDKALNAQVKQAQENKKLQEHQEKKEAAAKALEEAGASKQHVDLFRASSTGGETKIIGDVLEDLQRQKQMSHGNKEGIEDFDKTLTPAERVRRQENRFKVQTPILKENSTKINSLDKEAHSLDLIHNLDETGKIKKGINKFNINPITGSIIIPELATPEEQLFSKTINDFTVSAKDSYGGRVTNFELDRFMQRLPTLANSKEGRALIVRQMQLTNKVNSLEQKAIQKVFDEYGVRNIDFPDAERIARKSIEEQKERLREESEKVEDLIKRKVQEEKNIANSRAKEGYTALRKPDGTLRQYPSKNVPSLLEKGWKKP